MTRTLGGWLMLGLVVTVPIAGGPGRAQAPPPDPVISQRIADVQAMSPLRMAETSRTVMNAYRFLLERARAITNPDYRAAVLGMLENPSPSALGVPRLTAQSFLAAAGGGWTGHHAYPGGLAVHTAANLRHALNILAVYRDLYGVELDTDLVTGAVILHDVLKSYTNQFHPRWDEKTGKFFVPLEVREGGSFAAWGIFGLMGHHNEMMVTELMYRGAPPALVFAAHSHQDQYWDARAQPWLKASDETWERTAEEAIAKLEKQPGQAAKAQRYRELLSQEVYRNIETGINVLADKDWNITQGKAQPAAMRVMEAFGARYALVKDGKPYNMVRNWLFSRLDPLAILATWQRQGIEGALKLVESVFREPGKYEV